MILGDICTRACGFCAVKTGRPAGLDSGEPLRTAQSVALMKLKHVVITSVARDDLPDGGAAIWAETIRQIRRAAPDTAVEVLVPDFMEKNESWQVVFEARPDIYGHNLETVERLTPRVRSAATYRRSLAMLRAASQAGLAAKSGMMLGLGEQDNEVEQALADLLAVGVKIVTLGQYLRPTPDHLPVAEFVHPDRFKAWHERGLAMGFDVVEAGPMVRSSYHAEEQSELLFNKKKR
jgi:lipoic acid synthetase